MAIFQNNLSKFPDVKAAALLVHGLNNRPEVMHDIAQLLEALLIPSVIISLTGHHQDFEKLENINKNIWRQDVLEGYDLIRKSYKQVFFVGFSLGGSVGLDVVSERVKFDKMILLSPAIAPRLPVKFLEYISPILPSLPIYSMAPENYIANKYLPLKSYKVLLSIYKSLHKKKFSLVNVNTMLVIDPKDETMSVENIKSLITKYGLSKWKLLLLDSDDVVSKVRFHHLIIDKEAMGSKNWNDFREKVSAFLIGQSSLHI